MSVHDAILILSSGEHSLSGADIAGTVCITINDSLIGAGSFLLLRASLPEEEIPKDHHLRPLRLRRSSPAHHALSSGEHSLAGVRLPGATISSGEPRARRS